MEVYIREKKEFIVELINFDLISIQKNNLYSKPVGWGPWSDWSECDESCGGGNQSRKRTCFKNEGKVNCLGLDTENRSCNTNECPGKFRIAENQPIKRDKLGKRIQN